METLPIFCNGWRSCQLQEGNNWGDAFWGVHLKSEEGENNLGKLIMEIRAQLLV